MTWQKYTITATILIAALLAYLAISPSQTLTEINENLNIRIDAPQEIPLKYPFEVNGLALTGYFEGRGFAQVWLIANGKKRLVIDTDSLEFGKQAFTSACIETCEILRSNAEKLVVLVNNGRLTLKSMHLAVPTQPAGMAFCPDCKKISQNTTPDHSLFTLVILLFIGVVTAHILGHWCSDEFTKKMVKTTLAFAILILMMIFGVSMAAPTTAIATTVKQGASIISAIGVLFLFAAGALELKKNSQELKQESNVWNELEEAEDQWEKKE